MMVTMILEVAVEAVLMERAMMSVLMVKGLVSVKLKQLSYNISTNPNRGTQ